MISSGEFHTSCCGGSFGARPRNPIGTPLVLRVLGKKKEKKLQPRFRCQQTSHGSYESSTHALLNCGSSVHTHSEVTEKFMLVAPLFLLEPQSKSWGVAILTVFGAILAVCT